MVYDGWKPIGEFDAWGYFQAWNVYGPGADEILLRQQDKVGRIRFLLDRHGNVAFLVDDAGDLQENYTYDVFGQPKITDATGTVVRPFSYYGHNFLFQGREYIHELRLYDFRHRVYHPRLGRFIQTDPIGLQTEGTKLSAQQAALYITGGAPEAFSSSEVNLYRYCNNDPVNKTDPMGLIENSIENLRRRDRIDEEAKSHQGSHKWDFSARLDKAFKEFVNKCAKYVHDVTNDAGATPPTVRDRETGTRRSATAEELATQKFKDWRILKATDLPQRGDIGAYAIPGNHPGYTGHAGIITSGIGPGLNGQPILSNQSVHGDFGIGPSSGQFYRGQANVEVIFQRYTGE